MTTNQIKGWKPDIGETYFILSEYATEPYGFVWENSKADAHRFDKKILYPTLEDAVASGRKV